MKNIKKLKSMLSMFKVIQEDIGFLYEYLGLKEEKMQMAQ